MLYHRIEPNAPLAPYAGPTPFAAVVVVEVQVSPQWQYEMSRWLVHSGCLYMMAWGINCSSWDDSVDYANLEDFDYGDIPDEKLVMTTWHENDRLGEVFDFAKRHARPYNDNVRFSEIVVIHIANTDRGTEFSQLFALA